MGGLEYKRKNLSQALVRFQEAIKFYQYGLEGKVNKIGPIETEDLVLALRDSMIQRFEFTIELFWKFLKSYLEEVGGVVVTPATPRATVLAATKAALLAEAEAESVLKMFESRNLTSHMYQDRVARELAQQLPGFQALIHSVFHKLTLPTQ